MDEDDLVSSVYLQARLCDSRLSVQHLSTTRIYHLVYHLEFTGTLLSGFSVYFCHRILLVKTSQIDVAEVN